MPLLGPHLYYTLIASLPALERFDRVERLPITAERLRGRFRLLPPEDGELLVRVLHLICWRYQPFKRTDAETVAMYREMLAEPRVSEVVTFRANLRTAIAALRRRHLGQRPPPTPDQLGPGPCARDLIRNWERPDFGLESALPWLPTARTLLEAGESKELERHLLEVVWNYLEALPERHGGFRFEALVVYLFKWDVVERWLAYSHEGASERLTEHLDLLREDYRRTTTITD